MTARRSANAASILFPNRPGPGISVSSHLQTRPRSSGAGPVTGRAAQEGRAERGRRSPRATTGPTAKEKGPPPADARQGAPGTRGQIPEPAKVSTQEAPKPPTAPPPAPAEPATFQPIR